MRVLPESYHALGQDGNRFNGSIVSPQNDAIPANVAQALYNMSDHVPVIADFAIDATVGVADYREDFLFKVVNPVRDHVDIMLHAPQTDTYTFTFFSIDGKILSTHTEQIAEGGEKITLPFPYGKGFYLLQIIDSKQQRHICKIVK